MDTYTQSTLSRDDRASHRQRSPLGADRRTPATRNRSRSPLRSIDRYQPSRDDGRRDARRQLSHQGHRSTPTNMMDVDRYVPDESRFMVHHLPQNHIRDPMLEPCQVPFTHYAEWWRTENDLQRRREQQKTGRRIESPDETPEEQKARLQAAYDRYKCDWNMSTAKAFVSAHRSDAWFIEKYVPEVRDSIRQRVADFRSELFKLWEKDLDDGVFDDLTMEGVSKSDLSNSSNKMEREKTRPSEVLAVSDLLPVKGADLRDPVASMPALLIKTITPAASREELEAFCKQNLGEGEGGFRWLSLSDPNLHKKFHRLGWVLLNPSAQQNALPRQITRQQTESDGQMFDADGLEPNPDILTCAQIQERALKALDNKVMSGPDRTDFTLHVGIHKPSEYTRKKALWDLFSAPERVHRDLELVRQLVNKLDQRLEPECRAEPKVEQRIEDLVAKGDLQPPIVSKIVTMKGVDDEIEEGEDTETESLDVDDEDMLVTKKRLDLLVDYLRRVHNCCFYCVFETDSVHELQRKCASGHLRRPRAMLSRAAKEVAQATTLGKEFPDLRKTEDNMHNVSEVVQQQLKLNRHHARGQLQKAFNWVKGFEEKLAQWLEPENVDLRKLGGISSEGGLDEELYRHVKKEDDSKYRCQVPACSKLFKGREFWRKHVEKRHVELYDKVKEDVQLINDYVLDPAKLATGRTDASSNGHFPAPKDNHMGGTPRSYTPGAMPYSNGHVASGVTGMPSMLPPLGSAQLQGTGMGMGFGSPSMYHPGGISLGGRTRDRDSGSWERPSPRGMMGPGNGARGGNGGQMSPPGRSRAPAFIEGGAGSFSTGAAVEGRSMKSYNDLDAGAGAAKESDALDY